MKYLLTIFIFSCLLCSQLVAQGKYPVFVQRGVCQIQEDSLSCSQIIDLVKNAFKSYEQMAHLIDTSGSITKSSSSNFANLFYDNTNHKIFNDLSPNCEDRITVSNYRDLAFFYGMENVGVRYRIDSVRIMSITERDEIAYRARIEVHKYLYNGFDKESNLINQDRLSGPLSFTYYIPKKNPKRIQIELLEGDCGFDGSKILKELRKQQEKARQDSIKNVKKNISNISKTSKNQLHLALNILGGGNVTSKNSELKFLESNFTPAFLESDTLETNTHLNFQVNYLKALDQKEDWFLKMGLAYTSNRLSWIVEEGNLNKEETYIPDFLEKNRSLRPDLDYRRFIELKGKFAERLNQSLGVQIGVVRRIELGMNTDLYLDFSVAPSFNFGRSRFEGEENILYRTSSDWLNATFNPEQGPLPGAQDEERQRVLRELYGTGTFDFDTNELYGDKYSGFNLGLIFNPYFQFAISEKYSFNLGVSLAYNTVSISSDNTTDETPLPLDNFHFEETENKGSAGKYYERASFFSYGLNFGLVYNLD